jgi:hypothetical protein
MADPQDIKRATGGIAIWNPWAQARLAVNQAPVADFSGAGAEIAGISFEGFIFPGEAKFCGTEFSQAVSFRAAIFHGDANFNNVRFEVSACFDHARFLRFANFNHASFERFFVRGAAFSGEANFVQAKFKHSEFTGVAFKHALTRFTDASFKHVPDFWAATFATPPLFQRVRVKYQKYSGPKFWRRWISCASGEDDASRFRRLKQLASDWKDHQLELDYFAYELQAKRCTETRGLFPILLNLLYGWLSNFGRSVARPFWLLLGLTVVAAASIFLMHSPTCAVAQAWAALKVSSTNTALLLGADKWDIRSDAITKLCDACKTQLNADPLAYAQSGIGLLLLFLLALGLRNRFRIGST